MTEDYESGRTPSPDESYRMSELEARPSRTCHRRAGATSAITRRPKPYPSATSAACNAA